LTTYNRPAGFTHPGHPTVAPLSPHLSLGICIDHDDDSVPNGHSGTTTAAEHGSSPNAPPENCERRVSDLLYLLSGDGCVLLPVIFSIIEFSGRMSLKRPAHPSTKDAPGDSPSCALPAPAP